MKKTFFLLGFFGISTTSLMAQNISFGPEGGLNMTTMATKQDGDKIDNQMRFGFKIGGIIDIGFGDHLSLQPGVFYNVKGNKREYTTDPTIENITYHQENTVFTKVNYIEIPVNIQWMVSTGRKSLFFGAGPYYAFAVGGEIERKMKNDDGHMVKSARIVRTLEIGDDATDAVRSNDAGVNINLGYKLTRGLYVRGNVGIGLMNIMPQGDGDNASHNLGFTISAGYLLGR